MRTIMTNQPPTQAPQNPPSEAEHEQMARFGITTEQRAVYRYRSHRYERLTDALAYAAIDATGTRQARHTPIPKA